MKQKRYAGVLVKSKDKVLLCKRSAQAAMSGEWSMPSGKINEGETPIDGAAREFFEETNIKVTNPLTFCGMIKRYTRDGKNVKGLMYTFLMESEEELNPDLENAMDGDEHTECGYFTKDSLPTPIGDQTRDLIITVLEGKNISENFTL